jgi:hypothetical protein
MRGKKKYLSVPTFILFFYRKTIKHRYHIFLNSKCPTTCRIKEGKKATIAHLDPESFFKKFFFII